MRGCDGLVDDPFLVPERETVGPPTLGPEDLGLNRTCRSWCRTYDWKNSISVMPKCRIHRTTHSSYQNLLHPGLTIFLRAGERVQVVGGVFKEREIIGGFNGEGERFGATMRSGDAVCVEVRQGTEENLVSTLSLTLAKTNI